MYFVTLSFEFHLTHFLWINFKKPHVYSCFIVDTMLFSFVGTTRFKNSGHVIHFYIFCNFLISTIYPYVQISNILVNMLSKVGYCATWCCPSRHDHCHQERRWQDLE